jgi:hypothetical protein
MTQRFWITNDGTVRSALDGHAALARQIFDPQHSNARPSNLAIRLGYIAVTVAADGITLRYHQSQVSPGALRKLIEWLPALTVGDRPIIRSVYSGGWHSATRASLASAIPALEGAEAIATGTTPPPARVRRLPLSQLIPRLGTIYSALRMIGNGAEDLVKFAQTWPERDYISLFELCDGRAVLITAGRALGLYERALGRDLTERSDLRYSLAVRAELELAAREQEPAYYERRVTINGIWTPYYNLKIASGADRSGRHVILTASQRAVMPNYRWSAHDVLPTRK